MTCALCGEANCAHGFNCVSRALEKMQRERDQYQTYAERNAARLRRFAEIARAVEGQADGFGSELAGSRELAIVRSGFLKALDDGKDAYEAFCLAVDEMLPEVPQMSVEAWQRSPDNPANYPDTNCTCKTPDEYAACGGACLRDAADKRNVTGNAFANLRAKMSPEAQGRSAALTLALCFHEAYERLAPSFGYETRTETREFDPESKNGKLMVAVCAELLNTSPATGISSKCDKCGAPYHDRGNNCDGEVRITSTPAQSVADPMADRPPFPKEA